MFSKVILHFGLFSLMKSRTKSPLTSEQIDRLVRYHFGPDAKVGQVTELTGGWFNTAYLVTIPSRGFETVLKVAPEPGTEVHTYETNAMAIEIATTELIREKTTVPVPKIYASSFDRSIVNRDYFFMEKLKGKPWNMVKKHLSKVANRALEDKVADFQMQLNSLKGRWFGSVVLQDNGKIKEQSWYSAFSQLVEWMISDYSRFGVIMPRGWTSIRDLLEKSRPAFDAVAEPRLVDWDLWQGNVFVSGYDTPAPAITGIIDHERALWGDPLMEFLFMVPKKYPALVAKYKGMIDFPDKAVRTRRAFYNLYFYLIIYLETYSRRYPFLFGLSIKAFARVGFKRTLMQIANLS
nr:aminoglycoside phosphotransferase family protein [Candidatus Sigynarchaeota archaeon]